MRRRLTLLLLTAALAACCAAAGAQPRRGVASPTSTPASALAAQSTNQLALKLLERLGGGGGNVVFSPYSVETALAMVDQGAAGQTAIQIDRLLDTSDASTLASASSALRSRLARSAGAARLKIANGLWIQSGLSLERSFAGSLAKEFGAGPKVVDFKHQPAPAARAINAWVSSRTAGLINDLMPPDAVNSFTRLVLANAIYLKARWQQPFVRSETGARPFVTASGRRVSAQFMTQTPTQFRYGSGDDYRAIELPYRGSSLTMLLVMPTAGTLGQFEQQLTLPRLAAIVGSLKGQVVKLAMPRFHLIVRTELNRVLAALGMPIAFTPQADFSRITRSVPLQIQAVEHGADLKVDEAGTVAAAATGISTMPTAMPLPNVQLVLDHPFLALLRDDSSGATLFAAQVTDPTRP